MAGAFPPDYFAPDYFAPDYFGGETNPNAMSAHIAGTSSLTATLTNGATVPEPEIRQAGGGKKKQGKVKYEPPLPLLERPGLPDAYRKKKAPEPVAAVAADARVASVVADVKAKAAAAAKARQRETNNQAAATITMMLATALMEDGELLPEGEAQRLRNNQAAAATMMALAAALEQELI